MSLSRRFLNLFRGRRVSRAIDQEMTFHIEERVDDLASQGLPRYDARQQAERQFGAYAQHKENTWETNMLNWLASIIADVVYALRGFRRSPAFTAVAILSLALGIGANTAIFSLIDAVVLRALPVTHPEELKLITVGTSAYFSNPLWEQVRDRQQVFSGAFVWGGQNFNIAPGGETRMVNGRWVSGDFFATLGVQPEVGRLFTRAEDRRGCPALAVLSHTFWLKEYGGARNVIGKSIPLEGHPYEIIGVSRAGFTGIDVGQSADLFVPVCSEPIIRGELSALDRRSNWWLQSMGRLKPGVSDAQAKAQLTLISAAAFDATTPPNWSVENKRDYRARQFSMSDAAKGRSAVRRKYSESLWFLMAAVGLVLLIACANVANLLLARATVRQREMAVRLALGAGRGRLVRQTLTESLLLSFIGSALGLLFAQWGSRVLPALISSTGNTVTLDLHPDWRVLLFTAGVGTITGVLFGLWPAWRSSRVAPNTAMKAQGRGVFEGSTKMTLGKALVVVQVALSMVLIAGAGLMLSTFRNLSTLDPGFQAEGVLLAEMNLRRGHVPKESLEPVQGEILRRLRALPGVRSVSISNLTPLGNSEWNDIIRVEGKAPRPGDEGMVYFNALSDGYFETLSIPLIEGRDFTDRDSRGAPLVEIVNESMARKFFGKASALGQRIQEEKGNGWTPAREIVGVVRDSKYDHLREDAPPTAYIPLRQSEQPEIFPHYALRATGSPTALIAAVKEATAGVNPDISIEFIPLSQQVAEALTQERMLATLSTFFGALALLLAAIGLYGILSYNVERRRNEIGIRMALGAAQSRVLAMVMGEASWLAAVGLGLGLAGTLAATQLIKTFLFGLRPDDPPTLAASAAMLAAVAGIAAYLPARRAARLDPMVALRDE